MSLTLSVIFPTAVKMAVLGDFECNRVHNSHLPGPGRGEITEVESPLVRRGSAKLVYVYYPATH
jgi:hypothetical protein